MNEILFKDFIKLQRGFDLPKTQMIEGDYPVIGSTTIIGHHNEYKVDPPGVITGRSGSLGFVQYIKKKYWPHNTSLWVKDFKGNDPKYVYYFLKVFGLERFNSGAGVPTLNRNDLDNYEIQIQEIENQQKITSILSAYDDLIENNTRRIKILEEMAQTIYKEWFVNFRFPGYEKEKFADSPLGKIPEGWEDKKICECLDYYIGGGWGKEEKNKEYSEGAFVIRGTDIPSLKVGDISNTVYRFHKKSNLKSRKLEVNDIVFEVSGGSKDQPLGRSILIGHNLLNQWNEGVMFASFCKLIRIKKNEVSPYQLYLYLLNNYSNGIIEQYQVQSTGISNYKFESFINEEILIIPPQKIRESFDEIVGDIFNKIYLLGKKNSNLCKTRDLLLPKLMSGEVEV